VILSAKGKTFVTLMVALSPAHVMTATLRLPWRLAGALRTCQLQCLRRTTGPPEPSCQQVGECPASCNASAPTRWHADRVVCAMHLLIVDDNAHFLEAAVGFLPKSGLSGRAIRELVGRTE
jgi:hypothetical protein